MNIVLEELFLGYIPACQHAGEKSETGIFREDVRTVIAPEKLSQIFFFKVVSYTAKIT